jgi:hypothetical protein
LNGRRDPHVAGWHKRGRREKRHGLRPDENEDAQHRDHDADATEGDEEHRSPVDALEAAYPLGSGGHLAADYGG